MANNLRDGRKFEYFQVDNDLVDREDLDIYEKMVYVVLCRYANNNDSAFPSYDTIARNAGISKRKSIDTVASLIKKKLLKKKIRKEKGTKENTSNLYTVLSAKISSAPYAPPSSAPYAPPSAPHAPKKELIKNNYYIKNKVPQHLDFEQNNFLDDDFTQYYANTKKNKKEPK